MVQGIRSMINKECDTYHEFLFHIQQHYYPAVDRPHHPATTGHIRLSVCHLLEDSVLTGTEMWSDDSEDAESGSTHSDRDVEGWDLGIGYLSPSVVGCVGYESGHLWPPPPASR